MGAADVAVPSTGPEAWVARWPVQGEGWSMHAFRTQSWEACGLAPEISEAERRAGCGGSTVNSVFVLGLSSGGPRVRRWREIR